MKVTDKDFAILKEAIEAVDLPEYRERYRNREIARADSVQDINKRYRWDLYYFAARSTNGLPDSQNGYNMDHIDTALKRIVPDVE